MRNTYSNAAHSDARTGQASAKSTSKREVQLITNQRVCDMLSISRSTLNRWVRQDPEFPQPRAVGQGSVRWLQSEIEAFIETRERRAYDDHGFDPNTVEPDHE